MVDWNKISKEDVKLISAITKRAMRIKDADRICIFEDIKDLEMDISAAHLDTPLRLQEFLETADFDLVHAITAIQRNIDRSTGKLFNSFTPKFAKGETKMKSKYNMVSENSEFYKDIGKPKDYPQIINYKKLRTYTANIKRRLADIIVDCHIASEYASKIEEKEILEELKILDNEISILLGKGADLGRISAELLERKESAMSEEEKKELEEHTQNFWKGKSK